VINNVDDDGLLISLAVTCDQQRSAVTDGCINPVRPARWLEIRQIPNISFRFQHAILL